MTKAFKKLVDFYGSQTNVARALGVADPTVSNWVHGKRGMSVAMAKRIEKRTHGAVKATELLGL